MSSAADPRLPELSGKRSNQKTSEKKSVKTAAERQSRRSQRAALLLFCLLSIFLSIVTLPQAWRETSRREAYLSQLEAEAHRNPLDGRLLALLGGRLVQAGEYQAAADTLRRSLAAGEQDELIWLNLAAATAATGDTPRSVADLRLGTRTLTPAKAPDLSAALDRVQRLPAKSTPLEIARAISPQGPGALIRSYSGGSFLNAPVKMWEESHKAESGFMAREEWAAAKPDDPEAQRLWGRALMRNRRLPEAGAVLEHAVAIAPQSAAAHLAFANWLDAAGYDARATVAYIECLKLHPNWLPALLGVGKTSLSTGINGYALTSYEKATEVAPDSADAWIGLGRAYRKTGVDHAKAIAAFETVIKLAPDRTDYYDEYADALRQAVQWPAAETILRKRLSAEKEDPLAHYLLGMVLLNNAPTPERQAEAEAETREALRLFPHNPLALLQLAQIVLSRKQVNEAVDLLKDALQNNPYNRNAMSVLARAYRQSGKDALAEKFSKQADALYQDQQRAQVLESQEAKKLMVPGIHEELAQLYTRTGEPKKAAYEQSIAHLLRSDPKQAAEELKKFQATRSEALPNK